MAEYSTYKTRYVSGSTAYDYDSAEVFGEYAPERDIEIPVARKLRDEVVSTPSQAASQAISPVAIFMSNLSTYSLRRNFSSTCQRRSGLQWCSLFL